MVEQYGDRLIWLRRALLAIAPDLQDVLVFGGLACTCYGVAQIYSPAAWMLGGATLFWLGLRRT